MNDLEGVMSLIDVEPSVAELEAIAAEWPVVAAGLAVVAAECVWLLASDRVAAARAALVDAERSISRRFQVSIRVGLTQGGVGR